ncbi:MAG: hypothetical protein OWT28_13245 [Firmicutes bacterium]|nr:hypothetical protein [Bacillota bacterium]
MNQAVIMEFVDAETAIALTADMVFVRVAREPGMLVGAQVSVPISGKVAAFPLADRPATKSNLAVRRQSVNKDARARQDGRSGSLRQRVGRGKALAVGSAAAVLALAVVAFSGVQNAWAAPVAYVSLDVNPSVELAVNGQDRVVGADAMDRAGKRMLAQVSLTGLPIRLAIQKYMHAVVEEGYLHNGASVIVTTSAASAQETEKSQLSTLQAQVNQEVAHELLGHRYTLASLVISSSLRQAAHASDMSPGRLALYAQAKMEGQKVSWKALQSGHLSQAVGGARNLSKLVRTLSEDTQLVQALGHAADTEKTTAPVALAQAAAALVATAPPPTVSPVIGEKTGKVAAIGIGSAHVAPVVKPVQPTPPPAPSAAHGAGSDLKGKVGPAHPPVPPVSHRNGLGTGVTPPSGAVPPIPGITIQEGGHTGDKGSLTGHKPDGKAPAGDASLGVDMQVGTATGSAPKAPEHQPHGTRRADGKSAKAAGLGTVVKGVVGSLPVVGTTPDVSVPPKKGDGTGAKGHLQGAGHQHKGHGGGPHPSSAVTGRHSGHPDGNPGQQGVSGQPSAPGQQGKTPGQPGTSGQQGSKSGKPSAGKPDGKPGTKPKSATTTGSDVTAQVGIGVSVNVSGSSSQPSPSQSSSKSKDHPGAQHKKHKKTASGNVNVAVGGITL